MAREPGAKRRKDVGQLPDTVRAFYLDIAQWAAEDPARWARWAVPAQSGPTTSAPARNAVTASPAWTSAPGNASPSSAPVANVERARKDAAELLEAARRTASR